MKTPRKYTEFSQGRRNRFLQALRGGNTVATAALAAGMERRSVYVARARDRAFADAWDEAIDESSDILEQEAFRRAVEGVARPIVYRGKVVAEVREYSDRLLLALLRKRDPAWRETVNLEHRLRSAALAAGLDPDAAVAEAQRLLRGHD